MKTLFSIVTSTLAILFFTAGLSFADAGSEGHMHGAKGTTADGIGVLNSIDVPGSKVNISHEPIPALEWPAMTMDLPVGHHVVLSGFKAGQKVQFTVQKEQSGVVRIVAMCTTDKDKVVEGLCPMPHGDDHGHGHDDGHGHDNGHGHDDGHDHGDHGHDHP